MSQFIEMFGTHDTTPVGNYIEESYPGEWGSEDKKRHWCKSHTNNEFYKYRKAGLEGCRYSFYRR